jgi:hypothetical protein
MAPLADGAGLSLLLFALLTCGSVLMGPGVLTAEKTPDGTLPM